MTGKKSLLLLIFAMLALAASMTVRNRRAVVSEEDVTTEQPIEKNNTTKIYCSKDTPCAWSIYKLAVKIIEYNVTNTYCVCSEDLACVLTEDDTASSAFVSKCRLPHEEIEVDT